MYMMQVDAVGGGGRRTHAECRGSTPVVSMGVNGVRMGTGYLQYLVEWARMEIRKKKMMLYVYGGRVDTVQTRFEKDSGGCRKGD